MKVIIDKKKMREAIKRIFPTKIAVAYIGQHSETFIEDYSSIEAIIVRPTLGTNPDEVCKIAEIIGWENIHLLTTLHAKIYLGADKVLFGSCNLSYNGLGDYGLHEIAAYSDESNPVKSISGYFDDLLALADEEYPDVEARKHAIEQLKRSKPLSIHDSATNLNNIPLIWFTGTIEKYSPEGLDKYNSDSGDDFEENICEEAIAVTQKCKIRPGQFVLMYRLRENDSSVVKDSITWLYVHKLEQNFVDDKDYSNCVIQLKDLDTPIPPFNIDKDFRKLFADLMNSKPKSYPLKNIDTKLIVDYLLYKESSRFLNDLKQT